MGFTFKYSICYCMLLNFKLEFSTLDLCVGAACLFHLESIWYVEVNARYSCPQHSSFCLYHSKNAKS